MTTPRLDDQLCFALYAASRTVTGAYRETLTRLGLTYPQYLVLMALWESDGQNVSALGERLQLDSGTLSPLLKRLQARGLVQRRSSPSDERRTEVHLTEAGTALSAQTGPLQRCVADVIDLEAEEFHTLLRLARQVASLDAPAD